MRTWLIALTVLAAGWWPAEGRSDEIWLLTDEKPHIGEVLEETPHAIIIKFPKDQIQKIKRDKPLEILQWRERRILWQDTGDYIVLSLPKERVASTKDGESGKSGEGEKPAGLAEELPTIGAQRSGSAARSVSLTGRVVGKVISRGEPVVGCKIMLVPVGGQVGVIAKLFGGKKSSAGETYKAETDREGKYAFEDVMVGEYDLYWLPPDQKEWLRKLSEKPNLTVTTGETVQHPDIYIR
ncbi:MAG: carboxypeptidase regulatory-like domain-containing protein [Verrucomicrobia bacterium]|nr:carboxypeptidase regulatory-like domain-containing protein [Verrucomicrobiota bacterium]